jgi:hypothetical protein
MSNNRKLRIVGPGEAFSLDLPEPPEGWEAHDARVVEERARAESRARDRANLDAGIPKLFARKIAAGDVLPGLPGMRALLSAGADGGPPRRGIYVLSGPIGCGKSHAAAAWLTEFGGRAPMWSTAARLAATSRYDADARARRESATAMVLDDLGVEYADRGGSFLSDLDELVDWFYATEKPLVITTNIALAERGGRNPFADRHKGRIASRITESRGWLAVSGPDLRRRGGRQ